MTPRVTVVGLGPAGADLLTPRARTALVEAPHRLARTARHPALADLAAEGIVVDPLDAVYDAAPDLDDAYRSITATVVEAARAHGAVAYAVPGSPGVAERAVGLLHEAAARGDIELIVVPGLSFADLAWARLGIDPMGTGARVVDGRAFATEAAGRAGPLLVAQCDTPFVLSDVKLALLEVLPADAPVTVLARLGLADEDVRTVALEDLDRVVAPDHLTSVFVDTGEVAVAGEVAALLALAERLRAPGGCPWDAEQTHHSLVRYLLEEAYETVETIEALPPDAPAGPPDLDAYARLEDELGDLLYQVVFHAILAAEAGAFTLADVARGIHDKLVRRHPHVFGDVEADSTSEVLANWEVIKKAERNSESLVDGISPALPSLLYTLKLYRKAATVGLDPGDRAATVASLRAAADRVAAAGDDDDEAVGEMLAAAVALARAEGVDAESALRAWAGRFRERFRAMERLAVERGVDLHGASPEVARELWAAAG